MVIGGQVALLLFRPDGLPLVIPFTQDDVDAARIEVNNKSKLVALTFDDGPTVGNTDRLLDILDQYGVKATFFLLGKNVTADPQAVALIKAKGHEIGNHTYSHKDLTRLSLSQVQQQLISAADAIEEGLWHAPHIAAAPLWLYHR